MQKCPNCGIETAATEDWACQWCGYPLLSGSYKRIPKTYKQLKEERLSELKPKPELKPEPEPESKPEPEPEPEPELEPESKPQPVEMELAVEELLSAYAVEDVAADIKFVNKILKLTGVVAMIDVKDVLDINCIRLTGADRDLLQSVRCMFDKRHESALKGLTIGQTVTVQGTYDGSIMEFRMIDCVLVH